MKVVISEGFLPFVRNPSHCGQCIRTKPDSGTVLDPYRTPHSENLHVVGRWRMSDERRMLAAIFTIDDPDAFNQPWSGMKRCRRSQEELAEEVCAENNEHFDYNIPTASTPDF